MTDAEFQDARERFMELLCGLEPARLAELALYFDVQPAEEWHSPGEPIPYNAPETARRIWQRMLELRHTEQKVRDFRIAVRAITEV